MKTNTLVLLALSVLNVSTAVKFISGPEGWASAIGFNTTEQNWDDTRLSWNSSSDAQLYLETGIMHKMRVLISLSNGRDDQGVFKSNDDRREGSEALAL
jgi:hypothetical protein